MNIKMLRDGDDTTTYLVNNDGVETLFDYVSMIKLLHSEKAIGDTEFEGTYSDEERASIKQMVDKIAKAVIPVEAE
ncbi:hypothetical protein [Oscillibacter sp.]|uniref:hypothetical protein n=1 Tax=Oscillibacter sp. TaxID=1945593 RepID=UPI00339500F5